MENEKVIPRAKLAGKRDRTWSGLASTLWRVKLLQRRRWEDSVNGPHPPFGLFIRSEEHGVPLSSKTPPRYLEEFFMDLAAKFRELGKNTYQADDAKKRLPRVVEVTWPTCFTIPWGTLPRPHSGAPPLMFKISPLSSIPGKLISVILEQCHRPCPSGSLCFEANQGDLRSFRTTTVATVFFPKIFSEKSGGSRHFRFGHPSFHLNLSHRSPHGLR